MSRTIPPFAWLMLAGTATLQAAIPAIFEANAGQAPSSYDFVARSHNSTLLLSARETAIVTRAGEIRLRMVGAAESTVLEPGTKLESVTNYYLGGSAPFRVPNFSSLRARSVYPGVDLEFHSRDGALEHDFVVAPGGDPGIIRIAVEGSETLTLDAAGNLILRGDPRILEQKPRLYQDTPAGRRDVDGGFRILANNLVGFYTAAYDRTLPLIIDPIVVTGAGYFGGGAEDIGGAMASSGTSVVISGSMITNLPLGERAVVQLLQTLPATSVTWTTVFGGTGRDAVRNLSVDGAGDIFVAGDTGSADFPLMNAADSTYAMTEAFVTKLSAATGSIVFSTFFGGAGAETTGGGAVDNNGNYYICGGTGSTGLVSSSAHQSSLLGPTDAFFAGFSSTGMRLGTSYMGGNGADVCQELRFQNNWLLFSGETSSANLRCTSNAYQQALRGPEDLFFGQIAPNLIQVPYLSYLGGGGMELLLDMKVDRIGNLIMVGQTSSSDFPTNSVFPSTYRGGNIDGFFSVFRMNPTLTSNPVMLQSGFVGGSGNDEVQTVLPVEGPGGGSFGLILFGHTQSGFPSTLPGTANCVPNTFALATFHVPLNSTNVYQGCTGGTGTFTGSTWAPDGMSQFALATALTPITPPNPNTLFSPNFLGGASDVGLFRFEGFHDPTRWNGLVGVEQTSYVYPQATQANSPAGSLWVDLTKLPPNSTPGYLNLYIDGVGWVGQNLRYDPFSDVKVLSTPIQVSNATTSTPLSSVAVAISTTPKPETTFTANSGTRLVLPVTPRLESTTCHRPVTTVPPVPAKDRVFAPTGETWEHMLRGSNINVQTATNQCAPMSVANSLAFLASQHETFVLPNQHKPGVKGDNSLVGRLDTLVDRQVTSRTSGSGVYEQPLLTGKFAYLKAANLDAKLSQKFQGPLFDSTGTSSTTSDFTANGVTAKNEGAKITFQWLCDQIKQGEDVEVMYEWATGAHAVRIVGCGMVNGAPYIHALDDGLQAGNDPQDNQGLRVRRIFAANLGTPDLHWDNLNSTIVNGIAESFTNEVKQTPGGNPITWREAVVHGASFLVDKFAKGSVGTAFGFFASLVAKTGNEPGPRNALALEDQGTRVLLNGKPLPLYFASAGQINFQIPTDFPDGEATLQVEQAGKLSATVVVHVQATAPGVFLIGGGRGAIQNQDFSLHTAANGAKPGQALIVYVTGLGEKDVAVPSGQESPTTVLARARASVTATIGGRPARVTFAGLTPGFIGLEQVNIEVPDLAPGEYPLIITAGGENANSVPVNVVAP